SDNVVEHLRLLVEALEIVGGAMQPVRSCMSGKLGQPREQGIEGDLGQLAGQMWEPGVLRAPFEGGEAGGDDGIAEACGSAMQVAQQTDDLRHHLAGVAERVVFIWQLAGSEVVHGLSLGWRLVTPKIRVHSAAECLHCTCRVWGCIER